MGPPEYNWMPFGFSKAPATFQRLMQTMSCEDQLYILLVYQDNFFFAVTASQTTWLERVFQKMRDHGFNIQEERCQLFQSYVRYLGYVVSSEGVATDPAYTEAAVPSPGALMALLELASFYRRFSPGLA